MKRLLALLLTLSAAVALGTAAQAHPPPPVPGTTVSITNCGTNPQVTVGSSPFSGSVVPGDPTPSYPYTIECRIWFPNPGDPFNVIVDGSTRPGDYIAPLCNVQIEGPRTKYTVAVTAAGIHAIWDYNISKPVVPPKLVSWVCYYPWTPTADEPTDARQRSRAGPQSRPSGR